MKNEELKKNLTTSNHWLRLLYMVLFAVLLEIAGFVLLAVVAMQFLFSIITGSANDNLRRLGDQLSSFVYQTLQFLIYNTEEKPFPFSEWPESDVEDLSGYESAEEVDAEIVADQGDDSVQDAEIVEEKPIELGSDDDKKKKPARKSTGKGKESSTSD